VAYTKKETMPFSSKKRRLLAKQIMSLNLVLLAESGAGVAVLSDRLGSGPQASGAQMINLGRTSQTHRLVCDTVMYAARSTNKTMLCNWVSSGNTEQVQSPNSAQLTDAKSQSDALCATNAKSPRHWTDAASGSPPAPA
jgi:hypothetical protein